MKIISHIFFTVLIAACSYHAQRPVGTTGTQNLHADPLKNYCQAVAEYIKAVYNRDNPVPDTLYLGKNPEYPDIQLPASISNVPVKLMTADAAETYLKNRKGWVFLNVIGWPEQENPEFLIVTFFEGWKPQHNCHLYFSHIPTGNDLLLDSLKFEYPYPRK